MNGQIDTIKLNLNDAEIDQSSDIIVDVGRFNLKSGELYANNDLFVTTSGQIVRGNKAYLNKDKWNLTFYPKYQSVKMIDKNILVRKTFKTDIDENSGIEVEEENEGLFVQTSIPRLKSSSNFRSVSIQDEKEYLKYLETDLRKHGIKTNIWKSDISRVDSFININSNHTFHNYAPLFNLMECSRKKAVEWNGQTFLWKNSVSQLMCYDKIREMKNKNKKAKLPVGNFMRIESRYLTKRKVNDVLKFTQLSDLYKNYDVLKNSFKKEVSNNIFKYDLKQVSLLTDDSIKNEMIICKKSFNRNWFQKYLMLKGVQSIIRSTDIESILEVFESVESKVNVRVRKSRIAKMITELKMLLPENSKQTYKTNTDLYNELKTKFFKQVA